MTRQVQQNFLFIWILVLLSMALVLSLTFTGCSSNVKVNSGNDSQATATPTGSAVATGCSDTDGGQDQNVKGVVTLNGETKDDTCVGPFLVEYYCGGDLIANKNIKCECSKGKCVTT